MANALNSLRRMRGRLVLSALVLGIVALGWVAPAVAAGRPAEAPMQVMMEGLTAEEHLLRQVELSSRLAGQLPPDALERAVDVALSAAEISAIDQAPRWVSPLKVGLVKAMAPGIKVSGLSRGALHPADGGLVWAAVVRSGDAGAIRLHVRDLSLPKNAELYVYSRGGQAHGPYTGAGPNGTGAFWTTAIFGSEAIVQLRLAGPVHRADLRAVSFRIDEAAFITRKFANSLRDAFEESEATRPATAAACGNPNCVVDATCINNTIANNAKLAVAKMEWVQGPYIYTCTGGLLSDNNPSQSNFFLTANHCFSKNNVAQNVSFYWRFATSSCNSTSCPSNGGWPYITTGSTVSSTNRKSDYTLIRLSSNPPAGSVFLGWTSTAVANSNGADLFRVSNPNFGPQVYSTHDVDTAVGTCSGWPRGQWIYSRDTQGAIDGGSSGSPVLNASGQVVGQLSGTCGFNPSDPCASGPGEANATVDGAFAAFYPTIQPIINP